MKSDYKSYEVVYIGFNSSAAAMDKLQSHRLVLNVLYYCTLYYVANTTTLNAQFLCFQTVAKRNDGMVLTYWVS